jgi:hypothetical protein
MIRTTSRIARYAKPLIERLPLIWWLGVQGGG